MQITGLVAALPLGSMSECEPVERKGSLPETTDAPLSDQPVAPFSRPPSGAKKYSAESPQLENTSLPVDGQLLPPRPSRVGLALATGTARPATAIAARRIRRRAAKALTSS